MDQEGECEGIFVCGWGSQNTGSAQKACNLFRESGGFRSEFDFEITDNLKRGSL